MTLETWFGTRNDLESSSEHGGIVTYPGFIDSSALIDRAYTVLLDMLDIDKRMKDGMSLVDHSGEYQKRNNKYPVDDLVAPLRNGVYMPGTERDALYGEFDFRNDPPPKSVSLIMPSPYPEYLHVRRLGEFPPHLRAYKLRSMPYKYRALVSWSKPEDNSFHAMVAYFAVDINGHMYVARPHKAHKCQHCMENQDRLVLEAGIALFLAADSRRLWSVVSQEESMFKRQLTLNFGVDAEKVKSLFYARSLPLTPSGRRRPILHWVKAHQRRMAAGVDIDIARHLRGVEAFDMGGLHFRIAEPTKGQQK